MRKPRLLIAGATPPSVDLSKLERDGLYGEEMELLKDLPSYDSENFSRFSQGSCKVCE